MRTLARVVLSCAVGLLLCTSAFPSQIIGTAHGLPDRISTLAQSAGVPANQADAALVPPPSGAKSLADGLYMSGQSAYVFSGGLVTVTLDQINNASLNTTGTLSLSLWALTYQPVRGASINGYKLASFTTFNPLGPGQYYFNITRTSAFVQPPNGTYWIALALDEYDPAGCPGNADGFCLEDTYVSYAQETWGPTTPPSALENPSSFSYQSGIGLISGWSCQGPVSISVDGTSVAAPYGGPRADTSSVCSGNSNTGFGLLVNYNNFGPGVHTAQLYVNGVPSGSPHQFTVTVPSGEFMTGLSRSVIIPDFPTPGRNTTLIWQESQQNFAIESVLP